MVALFTMMSIRSEALTELLINESAPANVGALS